MTTNHDPGGLETALAGTFTGAELAELAHGLGAVPTVIRGGGSLAIRPLTAPGGPFDRLLAAIRGAAGDDPPLSATTRGLAPVGMSTS